MINYNDFPADSWDKPVDISEIRKIVRKEVRAEGQRIVECLAKAINPQPTVDAIPIKDIKDFLRCEKIDSCDWRNCSECSQMKCISIRNLDDLIEWSKGRENDK